MIRLQVRKVEPRRNKQCIKKSPGNPSKTCTRRPAANKVGWELLQVAILTNKQTNEKKKNNNE